MADEHRNTIRPRRSTHDARRSEGQHGRPRHACPPRQQKGDGRRDGWRMADADGDYDYDGNATLQRNPRRPPRPLTTWLLHVAIPIGCTRSDRLALGRRREAFCFDNAADPNIAARPHCFVPYTQGFIGQALLQPQGLVCCSSSRQCLPATTVSGPHRGSRNGRVRLLGAAEIGGPAFIDTLRRHLIQRHRMLVRRKVRSPQGFPASSLIKSDCSAFQVTAF